MAFSLFAPVARRPHFRESVPHVRFWGPSGPSLPALAPLVRRSPWRNLKNTTSDISEDQILNRN